MATLIENVNRIAQAKTDIKTAIENKGVTVSDDATIDTYPDLIDQIETGNGDGGVDVSGVTATASDVLSGTKFVDSSGTLTSGTMSNLGSNLTISDISSIKSDDDKEECYFQLKSGCLKSDYSQGNPSTATAPFGVSPYLIVPYDNLTSKTELTSDKIMYGNSVLGVDGQATYDATATTDKILSGQTAYVKGSKVTGTMNNYSSSTMPRNGTTSAITDISSQWQTTTGYGADMQFKLNFSGYVTPNTTVNQAVYGLHPAVIKKGHLIGGNGSAGGVGALVGTYEGDIHIYSKSCDISAGTWSGTTLSDSGWVGLCTSSAISTWTYYFDAEIDVSKIQFFSATFSEPTYGIRRQVGYASNSTTPVYHYLTSYSVQGNKNLSTCSWDGGIGLALESGWICCEYIHNKVNLSNNFSNIFDFMVTVYQDKIIFKFTNAGVASGHIHSTTPKFAFTIGYTD